MKLKLLPIVIISIMASTAYADSANLGDGLYIGLQGGGATGNLNSGSYNDAAYGNSVGGRIGYGFTFNNPFYIGAQLEGNWQNLTAPYTERNNTTGLVAYSNSAQFNNFYAVSILPGFHLNPNNLFYLKAGVGRGTYSGTLNTAGVNYDSGNTSKNMGVLGLGFETAVTPNLGLGIEYDYWKYFGSINNLFAASDITRYYDEQTYWLTLTYQLDNMDMSADSNQPELAVNNFYVGIAGGPENADVSHTDYTNNIWSQNINRLAQGWGGQVHVGYGYAFTPNWYLGAEVAAMSNTMAVSQPDGSLLRAHNGWSVSLLPGYMTSPSSLFFTRLGGIWTQFHGNVNETAGANMDSYNKTVPGWLLGFGYETAITEVLSVTLEYDYSIYQEYQTDGVIGNTNYSTKYDITSNAFNIGLNYRF